MYVSKWKQVKTKYLCKNTQGLTSIGLSPRTTILIMVIIPVVLAISYFTLPSVEFAKSRYYKDFDEEGTSSTKKKDGRSSAEIFAIKSPSRSLTPNPAIRYTSDSAFNAEAEMGFSEKIKLLRPLLKFMIPLFAVYYAEYFINQGLFELLYFKDSFIANHKDQYRWAYCLLIASP